MSADSIPPLELAEPTSKPALATNIGNPSQRRRFGGEGEAIANLATPPHLLELPKPNSAVKWLEQGKLKQPLDESAT
jgi:hypothetical protein